MLVLANDQKRKIIEGGRAFLNSLEMRICKTDITPTGAVMPAHTSDEPTDGGYVVVSNPYPNAFATVANQGKAVGPGNTYVWDHDAGDFTIFCVFFTDPADADVTVMAQRDSAPFTVTVPGQVYIATPAFLFDTYTP